jgi:hypothetical protein
MLESSSLETWHFHSLHLLDALILVTATGIVVITHHVAKHDAQEAAPERVELVLWAFANISRGADTRWYAVVHEMQVPSFSIKKPD